MSINEIIKIASRKPFIHITILNIILLFRHGHLLSQGRRGVGEVLQKTLSMVIESSARGC